jgi:hypothetical protein
VVDKAEVSTTQVVAVVLAVLVQTQQANQTVVLEGKIIF